MLTASSSVGSNETSEVIDWDIDEDELEPDLNRITGEKQSNMSGYGRSIDRKKKCFQENPILVRTDKLIEAITERTMAFNAAYRSTDENAKENTSVTGKKRSNMSGYGRSIDRKKKCFQENQILARIDKLTEAITERIMAFNAAYADENVKENTSLVTDQNSMAKCQDILTNMQVDLKIFSTVVKFLVDKPVWRKVFVHMTPEQRAFWVNNDFVNS